MIAQASGAAQRSYRPPPGSKWGRPAADEWRSRGRHQRGDVSYGLTICAERAALVAGVPIGPEIRVKAVAVVNLNGSASPPCGACRQVLAELIEPEAPVAFPPADGMRVMRF